jgi:hypothetical protein
MEGDIVLSFKSSYISKIIDYGRSYFNDEENKGVTGNAMSIYKEVCKEAACKPDCGYNLGFGWLTPLTNTNASNRYYISSIAPNASHDLWTLTQIFADLVRDANPKLFGLSKKVVYSKTAVGAAEKIASGLNKNKINNVMDACVSLQQLIVGESESNENIYASKSKLGDMHVYSDGRPLQYVSL